MGMLLRRHSKNVKKEVVQDKPKTPPKKATKKVGDE